LRNLSFPEKFVFDITSFKPYIFSTFSFTGKAAARATGLDRSGLAWRMAEESLIKVKFKQGYAGLFYKQWPPLTGGILLGLLSILIVLWSRPWGIVGGIRNWADWLFYGLGLFEKKPENAFLFSSSVLDIGFLLGAFGSALLAKEFALRKTPLPEIIKGLVGGLLMGVGSTLAIGCNVGAFYSPMMNLSASAFPMMIGLIIGAFIGLKYLLWELEKFPPSSGFTPSAPSNRRAFDWKSIQPYLGALVFLLLIFWAYRYAGRAYTESGVLLLFGGAFGLILQRCRFCYVRAFRDPFMTGEAVIAKALALSIIIGAIGISIIKWNGIRPESLYVIPAFWQGSLAGGMVFGIGMVIAGGCGSGTLWRVAEGQLKLWAALLTFATSNSLLNVLLRTTGWRQKLGKAVFLPYLFGWGGTILLIAFIMLSWYLLVSWNEESNKFTVGL
jgi:uncharacterized protein